MTSLSQNVFILTGIPGLAGFARESKSMVILVLAKLTNIELFDCRSRYAADSLLEITGNKYYVNITRLDFQAQ